MNIDLLSIILVGAFSLPILNGMLKKYSVEDLKYEFINAVRFLVFGGSMILGFRLCKKIILYNEYDIFTDYIYEFISKNVSILKEKPIFIYLIAAPIMALIIYMIAFKLIKFIIEILVFPLFGRGQKGFDKCGTFLQRIFGAVMSIPKAVVFTLLIVFGVHIYSITWSNPKVDEVIAQSDIQKELVHRVVVPLMNSNIANKIPGMVTESLKIDIEKVEDVFTESINVYYNGITIDEGVLSHNGIRDLTKDICKSDDTDRESAYIIYRWIVDNIKYDAEKAKSILNDDFIGESGAISTFNTQKGVCFDLACLFASMSIEKDIPVRIIAGKGYNGEEWIDHSWNQVYLSDEDKWVDVDATFGLSSNYFDNIGFNVDHKEGRIIGEW